VETALPQEGLATDDDDDDDDYTSAAHHPSHFICVRPLYFALGHYITVDDYGGRLETSFTRLEGS